MAAQIQIRTIALTFTVPANTTAAAPFTQNVNLGQTQITQCRVRIPRGHVRLTGFAFRFGGTRIIPWDDPNAWIVGDDETMDFDVYLGVSVPITLIGFNTDVLSHGFEVRFTVDDSGYLQSNSSGTLISPL